MSQMLRFLISILITPTMDPIVTAAAKSHLMYWKMTGNESSGDKLAALVTREWQAIVRCMGTGYATEYSVAPHLRERIDVVDTERGIAYELKVSPNNAHFEFYRDIFKVITCRKHQLPSLRKFVFIVPKSAAERLTKGLGAAVIGESKTLNLEIVIEGI